MRTLPGSLSFRNIHPYAVVGYFEFICVYFYFFYV